MRKTSLLISLLVIVALATLSACKKKTDPVPDYPQFIGHWAGTTSQGTAIYFTVDNLKGNLNVTRYDLTVYTSSGYHQYRLSTPMALPMSPTSSSGSRWEPVLPVMLSSTAPSTSPI